jgi:hypothetical protein
MSRFPAVHRIASSASLLVKFGVPSAWRGGVGSSCVQWTGGMTSVPWTPVQGATQIHLPIAQSTVAEGVS